MVYTTGLCGGRRGAGTRNGFQTQLRRLGVTQINSTPNHPTTCGRVERFQQTMKKWLPAQDPNPPPSPSSRPCSTGSSLQYNHR